MSICESLARQVFESAESLGQSPVALLGFVTVELDRLQRDLDPQILALRKWAYANPYDVAKKTKPLHNVMDVVRTLRQKFPTMGHICLQSSDVLSQGLSQEDFVAFFDWFSGTIPTSVLLNDGLVGYSVFVRPPWEWSQQCLSDEQSLPIVFKLGLLGP